MDVVESPAARPDDGDRTTRLVVAGGLQILIGCFCGLLALLFVVALIFLRSTAQARMSGPPLYVQAALYSVVLAAAFLWLGTGLIAARRWAWTLTVVTSWIWLVFGTIAFISVVFVIGPRVYEYTAQQGKTSAQITGSVRVFTDVLMAILYIGLPAILLLISCNESVRATCVKRDPRIPWTDRCPMPVLARSLFLVFSIFSLRAYRFAVPAFGIFVSGTAGTIAIALIAIIHAYLAWGAYRLKMTAWWGCAAVWHCRNPGYGGHVRTGRSRRNAQTAGVISRASGNVSENGTARVDAQMGPLGWPDQRECMGPLLVRGAAILPQEPWHESAGTT